MPALPQRVRCLGGCYLLGNVNQTASLNIVEKCCPVGIYTVEIHSRAEAVAAHDGRCHLLARPASLVTLSGGIGIG